MVKNKKIILFIGWEIHDELPLKDQDEFENYDRYEFFIDGGLPNVRKMSGEDWHDDQCFEDSADFEDFWGISYQKKCGDVYFREYENWPVEEEKYFRDLARKFDGDQLRIKEI